MQRLEITGETPEALYFNVVKTLSIFLRGAPQTAPVESVVDHINPNRPGTSQPTGAIADTQPPEGQVFTTSSTAETAPVKEKRKASPGKMTQKAAQAGLNDDISDVGGAAKTIEHDKNEVAGKKPELTLDGDIRPRLQAIQKAHTERGHDMPAVVAYIQKLYGPFGIAKIPQLKPEQFEEFMEASEGYLSGEA